MNQPAKNIDLLVLYTGIFFISIITLPFVFQSVLFMVNVSTSRWLFPLILAGVFAVCIGQLKQSVGAKPILIWACGMALLLFGIYQLCITLYDFSYDGMWYQQDGVRLIAQGWNPFKQYLSLSETSLSDLYLNHYAKASWIASGSIYAFTNKLESGKMINWYAMLASACFCYLTLKSVFTLSRFVLIVLTVFFALNPVVIYQLFTFYVDGLMGSMLLGLLCLGILFYTQKITPGVVLYCISVLIVFTVNIKFTALIYVGVFALGYLGFIFLYRRRDCLKHTIILGVVSIVGIVALGYPTYMRNTITHGHPFYPLMGKGNIGEEVAKVTMPANFFDKNRFEQFNLATFAKAQWSRAPYESHAKALFSADSFTILDEYKRADPDMSGFGPLFAEILLLVGLGLVAVIILNRKQLNGTVLWVIGTLILSIIIIPAFWYARYVPQLWVLVLFLSIIIVLQPKLRFLAYLIWIFVLVNCVLVAQQNTLFRIKQTHTINKLFDTFKQAETYPVIYDGWVASFKIKLKEEGVPYIPTLEKYPKDSVTFIPNVEMSGAFVVNSSFKHH